MRQNAYRWLARGSALLTTLLLVVGCSNATPSGGDADDRPPQIKETEDLKQKAATDYNNNKRNRPR